ncbi:MAG: hypothetical protein RBT41_02970 [Clostridia bacterium]|jgi:hypothetical protein|nr:hypothetical protein [Clostridia bacterium]
MMWTILLAVILILLVIWATRARMRLRFRTRSIKNIETSVASPVSTALGELIAIAGGIYLSFILLKSFLDLSVPESIRIFHITIDPLAFLAIIIALVQPVFLSFYEKYLQ